MTPSNALFRRLWITSSKYAEVTDKLNDNEGYPYVHMKESYDTKVENAELMGTITQVIDVWGFREQRNETDELVTLLHNSFSTIRESFAYNTRMINFRYEQLPEYLTGSDFVRYRIEVEFRYTKKEVIQ